MNAQHAARLQRLQDQTASLLSTTQQDSADSDEYAQSSRRMPVRAAIVERSSTDIMSDADSAGQQPSLAQSLRQRREFVEHMEQERYLYGMRTGDMSKAMRHTFKNMPS